MLSIIFTVITIFLFPGAFFLSHQGGADTDETSMFLTVRVCRLLEYFGINPASEEQVNMILRSSAHVVIFLILTTMLCISFMLLKKQHHFRIPAWVGAIFCVFCAWADEATKIFVDGRHFSVFDVGLNLVGCGVGFVIYAAVSVWISARSGNRNVSRETL